MAPKTLIFIPTYNERDNVGPMCEQIVALRLDADLLFVDDASPDGTGQVLDELAAKHPRVRVVHRAGKAGIGSAHKAGIHLAYDEGYERLVTLDCDFTHRPEMIPQFLERCATADAVVGSRYLEPGSLPGWSALRKSLTTLGHVLTKNVLGISQDATGAFRAYNLTTIRRDIFQLVESNGYAFFFESMLVLQRNGLAVAEIPITLPARTYGSSKMTIDEVRRSVTTLMTLFVQDQTNPGRFRASKRSVELDPALVDPQNWNQYWDAKSAKTAAAYDLVAALYRNSILKRRLEATISDEFPQGARLLHAGCGGGPVDANLHQRVRITAVDISPSALDLYRRSNPDAEEIRHADIMNLPFPDSSFDGAYNLGVVEHYDRAQLTKVFSELRRVIKPKGKLVVFWPHAHATSVAAFSAANWLLNDVMQKNLQFRPPEVSLVHSAQEAAELLASGGFELKSYEFGPKDLFVQAKVVATCQ